MGHPRAVLHRFRHTEATHRRQPPPLAGGLPLPRTADDSDLDERRPQRPDQRWAAHARQGHVLLQRLQADSAFQDESTHPGSPGQGVAVLEDLWPELSVEELPGRPAVRQPHVRAPVQSYGGGSPGDLQRGILRILEVEYEDVFDRAAGEAGGEGEVPLLWSMTASRLVPKSAASRRERELRENRKREKERRENRRKGKRERRERTEKKKKKEKEREKA